jgi:hypothetical protein
VLRCARETERPGDRKHKATDSLTDASLTDSPDSLPDAEVAEDDLEDVFNINTASETSEAHGGEA